MRPVTPNERAVIAAIADALPSSQGKAVKADLALSKIIEMAADGSRLVFGIADYERPKYRGQHPLAVEGTMKDVDGADLHVLLHVDENERLFELELIRWAEGPVIGPDWASFKVLR